MSIKGYTTFYCQEVKWLVREDIFLTLREQLLSRLSSPEFFTHHMPVKEGAKKSLWHYALPESGGDEVYIIKRYQRRGLIALLKNIVAPSKPLRELRAAVAIDQRGIPTTLPVAVGERSRKGFIKEGYVVIKKLEECQDLNHYFLRDRSAGTVQQDLITRWMIIREFGRLAKQAHEKGILQRDFSLNNFLLTGDAGRKFQLYLSDFEKVTIRRRVSLTQRIRCLAKLNRVGREVSITDRLRFLRSYQGSDDTTRVLSLAQTIQRYTIKFLKQDIKRERITSVYTDALYSRYEDKGVWGYYRTGYSIEEILELINRFDLLAKSFPSASVKEREELHIELTCDGRVQPLTVVRYLNHPTVSVSSLWTKMCALFMAGVPLTLPHIVMEVEVKDNREGYLFIPRREDEVPLRDFLKPSLDKRELSLLMDLLLKMMERLHCFGTFSDKLTESDFKVVEREKGRPSLYLKSIERFDFKKEVLLSEKKRELVLLSALIKKYYPTMTFDLIPRYFKKPGVRVRSTSPRFQ